MKTRRSSGWRRTLPAAGLLALAAYLVTAGTAGLAKAWVRVDAARAASRDDTWGALARQRGRGYADAIARIREALPEDSEYLLFENDGASDMLVRFDLAPRRAVFGGRLGAAREALSPDTLETLPRWAVIPRLDPPGPSLVETRVLAEKGALP